MTRSGRIRLHHLTIISQGDGCPQCAVFAKCLLHLFICPRFYLNFYTAYIIQIYVIFYRFICRWHPFEVVYLKSNEILFPDLMLLINIYLYSTRSQHQKEKKYEYYINVIC